ncbi:arrestin/PY protein 2 [Schizosaccharomyces japonicus yFS275]|uniref:Arrestin/PY protein 2 n=1 Tax=Schizosaccharomyces japonicus (strain yFS275 / FY16936) TaxID=402676 RepID=B6JYM3_SCHJY|nr:arrestin/PY protein 2 [Schizosaccharomyces japonicus yFS275]EEB06641.1 arrestin/PY protein 2 [Schizosaccharomyces japonicus yFS275]
MSKLSLTKRSSNPISLFEVRLFHAEANVIVLYGESVDTPVALTGVVVLSVRESFEARSLVLRLDGRSFVSWNEETRPGNSRTRRQSKQLLEKRWSFLPFGDGVKTIGKGNYEYPFEYTLPPDLQESIEGISNCYIVYSLTASLERAAYNTANIETRLPFRIVRTIPPNNLDLLHTVSVSDIWPSKVNYETSIPSKIWAVGSEIPVSVILYPLLKGLDVGKITVTLKEYRSLFMSPTAYSGPARKDSKRVLARCTRPSVQLVDECWKDVVYVKVPDSLTDCTQDCDLNCIRVRHKLRIAISLVNPDGHVSELRTSLPITLVISPVLFGVTPVEGVFTGNVQEYVTENTLPSYERHIFDVLWDGIPFPCTPLPSTFTTPATSRRNSFETERPNLAALTSSMSPNTPIFGGFSSDKVPSSPRPGVSENAHVSEHSPRLPPDWSSSEAGSASQTTNINYLLSKHTSRSRAGSVSSVLTTNFQQMRIESVDPYAQSPYGSVSTNGAAFNRPSSYMDLHELTKVPTYGEAVNSSCSSVLPLDGLPDYETATRPTTPEPEHASTSDRPAPPLPTPAVPSLPLPIPPQNARIHRSRSEASLWH